MNPFLTWDDQQHIFEEIVTQQRPQLRTPLNPGRVRQDDDNNGNMELLRDDTRERLSEPAERTPARPREEPAPPPTSEIDLKVAGYNVFQGDQANQEDMLEDLVTSNDIISLQEATSIGKLIAKVGDRYGIYYGKNDQPIFFNKEKFDIVHGETQVIHGPDEHGADHGRSTTFVVLRDKASGKNIVVSNTHLDNKSEESRQLGSKMLLERGEQLKEEFNAQNHVSTGDFNSIPKDDAEMAAYADGDPSNWIRVFTDDADIAHDETKTYDRVDNGDFFPHRAFEVDLKLYDSKEVNPDDYPAQHYGGTVMWTDTNMRGDVFISGFGERDVPSHSQWNDRVSSVYVSDGAVLDVATEADGGGRSESLQGYRNNVGDELNDKISQFVLTY